MYLYAMICFPINKIQALGLRSMKSKDADVVFDSLI